ncbi:hypothetical protein [Ramlibacter pallidus]|uniref:DUF4230 domain-containing protein n=1 Tax=Ramlibacter pallidus TaxID=2780087 RepID=A0ABR9S633_9BURK|nr:hypothetical protein [Ramlibacter pallidus]MBE7368970.1 hypothetical protein [Ramlibacter pallidus]
MKHRTSLTLAAVAVAAALGAGYLGGGFTTRGEAVATLDPARVEFIRTPGGFLQVAEMRKVEEFAWQTAWACPFVDCSGLPKTISRVRVKAQFVFRIPLAERWKLEPEGDRYKLTVPPLQLQAPVAFDTGSMEIVTTEQSVFSPGAAPNRENAVRHLGPELAQRGASPAYLDAQRQNAERTVVEFARKWMLEQGRKDARPIRVVFDGPNPL